MKKDTGRLNKEKVLTPYPSLQTNTAKHAHWEKYYVCSGCGEHTKENKSECPFCHAKMRNV